MSINKFFLGGYVGRDPEVFESNNEKFVGFSFAENGITETGDKKVAWHQVTTGGKLADTVLNLVKKGDKLVIEGKVTPDAYFTKDNKVVPQLKIWLTNFEFASSRNLETEVNT